MAGSPARVRFVRAPLGADPDLEQIVAAIDGLAMPFVLAGRWGLPAGASPQARVVLAGAVPSRLAPSAEPIVRGHDAAVRAARSSGVGPPDPFAILDEGPELVGEAPAGAVGGGWFGWLGYGLGRSVERMLGPQPWRPEPLPLVRMAWYDEVLRRDELGVWWVEALVPPDSGTEATLDAAVTRWQGRLAVGGALRRRAGTAPAREDVAPDARGAWLGAMQIHRGPAAHRAAVAETVERIAAGEVFQANVCLRLTGTIEGSGRPSGLAAPVLSETDPWFGAWIGGADDTAIVSASPELFLRRRGRDVTTGPIKGTAPRVDGEDAAADALLASEKDRAEHVMIVDLMRNDLGRVCDYGSVRYEAQPHLEPHAGVWHLVSEVGGRLHDGLGDARLLRATFPPGSVTGAPKVQAMRVIAAVEGTGREVYTGAHGFVSPVAGLEFAVSIRTIESRGERAWIGVGGGIVADSDPSAELAEALTKASALVAAAGGTIAGQVDGDVAGDGAGRCVPWVGSFDPRPDPAAGLVDTIAVRDGQGAHVQPHLERITASAAALGYGPLLPDVPRRITELAATATERSRLRVVVRGDVELQLVPARYDPAAPIDLAPVVLPGGLGPHKWVDRRLVDALTQRHGATPLLLDADGTVLEAGWANVWWVDGDMLCTPPLDGRVLPGVTRALVLQNAEGRAVERTARFAEIAELPLLLTSARGFSIARLATTPPRALEHAARLASSLADLV